MIWTRAFVGFCQLFCVGTTKAPGLLSCNRKDKYKGIKYAKWTGRYWNLFEWSLGSENTSSTNEQAVCKNVYEKELFDGLLIGRRKLSFSLLFWVVNIFSHLTLTYIITVIIFADLYNNILYLTTRKFGWFSPSISI